MQAGLEPGDDVRVHPVADHRGGLRVRAQRVQAGAHHERVRLAHVVGDHVGRARDERRDRAGRRQRPAGRRTGRVGVRRDEPRAVADEADRPRDRLEGVRARLAEDDVVGVALGQRVADLVQRGGETRLADDVRRAVGPLAVEELGGRQRRRPQRVGGHVDPARPQARREVARRVDGVVREDQEPLARRADRAEELLGAGQRVLLVHEHAVHVDEVVLELVHVSQRNPP